MPIEGVDECIRNTQRFFRTEWGKDCLAFRDVVWGRIIPECEDECPVDEGTMQASIPAVSKFEFTESMAIATIGAGGAASAYARRQHEDLTLHHPPMTKSPGSLHSRNVAIAKYAGGGGFGGQKKAKFIEDPLMRNSPYIPKWVKERRGNL